MPGSLRPETAVTATPHDETNLAPCHASSARVNHWNAVDNGVFSPREDEQVLEERAFSSALCRGLRGAGLLSPISKRARVLSCPALSCLEVVSSSRSGLPGFAHFTVKREQRRGEYT